MRTLEEEMRRVLFITRTAYAVFWIVPLSMILFGETCEGTWVGVWADQKSVAYYVETSFILLTALCVPLSLRLFARKLRSRIDRVTIPVALKLYLRWTLVRLLLLAFPAWTGMAGYYLLMSDTCVLCSLIALTASFFCVPGEARMYKELNIDKEGNNGLL